MNQIITPVKIKPNVSSVDIRKFIVVPEFADRVVVEKIVKDAGFSFSCLSAKPSVFYVIEAFGVLPKDKILVDEKLLAIRDEIKSYLFDCLEKNHSKVDGQDQLTDALTKIFVNSANKDIDKNELLFILKSVFKDLYTRKIEGVELIPDTTLQKFVDAVTTESTSEAKQNLDEALIDAFTQIKKLIIVWFFEAVSFNLYNLRTDLAEIPSLQHNKLINYAGQPMNVLQLRFNSKPRYVAFDSTQNSLITFGLGNKMQEIAMNYVFFVFIDNVQFHIYLEYFSIIFETLRRQRRELMNSIRKLQLDYDKVSLDELIKIKEFFEKNMDGTYRLLLMHESSLASNLREIKLNRVRDFKRELANALGGAISKEIKDVSIIRTVEDLDELLVKIKFESEEWNNTKFELLKLMNELIEAKKQKDSLWWRKILGKIQEIGENVAAKVIRGS